MKRIQEYDVVRVTALNDDAREFQGSQDILRPPQIGDVGTVCHEYDPNDLSAKVVVEMVTDSGLTVWVADFDRDELELIPDRF